VENSVGTFGLYCVLAEEAVQKSIEQDSTISLGNVAEWMKTLCAHRRVFYDGDIVSKAIDAVLQKRTKAAS
jgi:hypothetical protein